MGTQKKITSFFLATIMLLSLLSLGLSAGAVGTLMAGSADRISDAEAMVAFTASEAGTYYYEVVADDAVAPTIDTTGTGVACDTNKQTISLNSLTAGAWDIYIVVKDEANTISDKLKIDIPQYDDKSGGLYITEIYPNDVDRTSVYGNSSDHMEYVELTNTTKASISFNSDYGLYYEYPSGTTYKLKLLTVTTTDGGSVVNIAAGETVILWDRRDDVASHASEADFRTKWLVPDDVQIFVASGQAGFGETDRGFSVKKLDTGEVVSHYRYTTGVDTSDGLAVHLAIPDSGYEMKACLPNSFGSPGTVYSEQLNRDKTAPEDLTPKGLYITEIRPNDVDRSATYGTSDDYMECMEVFNSTDADIDFNNDYQFAYLYKASYLPQTVTTVTNAISGNTADTSGVIIPAHGTAVIWCYRGASLTGYTSFPTEDDFREAYGLSENMPVYAQTGQNGWANTDRGVALLKKNADGSLTNESYYFWNGVTDLVNNKSVDLSVSADGPKMSIYKANSTTNMGVVAEAQYTFFADDGSSPVLQLLDDSETLNQGQFLRIPYYYAGSSALPVASISLYYKTNDQDTYTEVPTTSFSIYNKYYAFIDNAELLEADYVDYYLKASNAYRTTTTNVRRISMIKNDDYSGLRVNFDSSEAENNAVVSDIVAVSAKNFGKPDSTVSFTVDGNEVGAGRSLERQATFTFNYSGVDSYFKNALTTGDEANGKVISVFAKCSEIPTTDSLAIPVAQSLFTYNEDGTASIELALRAGTYGSPWEANTAANNDDFTAGNFKLHLTDGTILSPDTTVDMNGVAIDPTAMAKLGDSASCTICVVMTFTIPADKVDATSFMLDTTTLPDGNHTLSVVSGDEQKSIGFTVKNSASQEEEKQMLDVNVNMNVSSSGTAVASISTDGDVSAVTICKAEAINAVSFEEGAGDSTASAAAKTGTGATVSVNGDYPYQILSVPVTKASINALRIEIQAEVNYSQPIQLYVLNTAKNTWDIIDNTTEVDGTITGICPLDSHVADGIAKVLIQARGTEFTPYTQADAFTTTLNNYEWDGTAVPEQYDFSVAWITDTQYYSEQYPENFSAETDWIVDNKDNMNIQYVVHTGDIVDEFNEEDQYVVASGELEKFEEAGIPYGVLAGNHDVAHGNMRYGLYWKYFGEDRYEDSSVYGGSYNNNLGHYDLVTVNGEELLFLYMSWDIYYPETDWINSVLAQYPDRKAIICTHCGINAEGTQSYISDFLLQNVCQENTNVFAIINGHYHGSSLNFVGFDDDGDGLDDRTVYQICTDYQSAPEGGSGYIKMIYFDLENDKVYLNSYSPVLNDYNYFDTAKLDSYGVGTVAADIDITELSVDFDRASEKDLVVSAVSVNGLTSDELGSASRSGSITKVNIDADVGEPVDAYAILTDSAGNILGYTDTASFTVSGSPSSSDDTGSSNTTSDVESILKGNTATIRGTINNATSSSGKVSGSVGSTQATALIAGFKQAEAAGKRAVVEIKMDTGSTATLAEISIPKNLISDLANSTSADLTIATGMATVRFNASAVDAINAAASGEIKISIALADTSGFSDKVKAQIGNRPVYDFTVTSNGKTISSLGSGNAHISLPYKPAVGEDTNAIIAYYINDSGELTTLQGNYNAGTGMVEFIASHFSTYAVGYNKLAFSDVNAADWYYKPVTFMAARGITTGTGSGGFSPNDSLTRGQFIVLLMRAYGIEADKNTADNFSDAGDTYYTGYLAAAKRLGISKGVGDNNFAPENEIMRQDMFTLLYRALSVLGKLPQASTSTTVDDFVDADHVSAYANDAINAFIKAGIISGSNGKLDPMGLSTRAQMAQVLYKLLFL